MKNQQNCISPLKDRYLVSAGRCSCALHMHLWEPQNVRKCVAGQLLSFCCTPSCQSFSISTTNQKLISRLASDWDPFLLPLSLNCSSCNAVMRLVMPVVHFWTEGLPKDDSRLQLLLRVNTEATQQCRRVGQTNNSLGSSNLNLTIERAYIGAILSDCEKASPLNHQKMPRESTEAPVLSFTCPKCCKELQRGI